MLGGIGGGNPLDRLFNGSEGMKINRMLDALGLPDQLGDMIGAQIDAAKGDWAGYARNMMDLTSGMSTDMVDKLYGRGLPGPHFAPRPFDQIGKSKKLWSHTFHTPWGDREISREKLGGKGLFGNLKGKALEAMCMKNPAFKAMMEAKLGGRIILDGRADGKITVERFRPHFQNLPFSNQIANNPMLSGIYGGLSRLEQQLKDMLEKMTGGAQKSGGANPFGDPNAVGGGNYDTSAIGSTKEDRELAEGMGIDLNAMSFEDLLFMMMMKYAKKKEKEIIGKMNELSQGQGQQKDANGKDLPYGDAQKTSDTLKQMQMQKLMEDLKKMYEMLSNVMKSMSDMQMAAVRNLR